MLRKLNFLTLLTYLVSAVLAIVTYRTLYADGVYFFYNILQSVDKLNWPLFDDTQMNRQFINYFNQSLVSTYLFIGGESKALAKVLYGIPFFVGPLLAFAVCHKNFKASGHKEWILFPFATYVLFVFVSNLFLVNPALNAVCLYWVIASFAVKSHLRGLNRVEAIIMVALIVVTLKSHETILLVGPVLALFSFWTYYQKRKAVDLIGTVLLLASAFYTAYWLYTSPISAQTQNYLGLILSLFTTGEWYTSSLFISCLTVVTLAISLIPLKNPKLRSYVHRGIAVAFSVVLIVWLARYWQAHPFFEYQTRSLISFGTASMAGLMVLVCCFRPNFPFTYYRQLFSILCLSFIAQNTAQIFHSLNFSKLLHGIDYAIDHSNKAILDPRQVIIDGVPVSSHKYLFTWTNPSLSIINNDSYNIRTILAPVGWEEQFKMEPDGRFRIPFIKLDNAYHNFDGFYQRVKQP
ncbi:MAG: hypothetical protein HRT35_23070 [Algicola sp.]|nr:hypothetical protein [Algicola sp.]